jgi:ribosomal protein L13E
MEIKRSLSNIYYIQEINQIIVISRMKIERPIVKRTHANIKITRSGRGYSKLELMEAGFSSVKVARMNGVPIDVLRDTSHPENVKKLKLLEKEITELRKLNLEKTKGKSNRPKRGTKARPAARTRVKKIDT